MKTLPYYLVDVFTSKPFGGNPLAIFPEADDLSQEEMQQIAQELNLSETTFLQRAKSEGGDCTVRIFTPRCEVPMAGHPTIGTAFIILEKALLVPKLKGALVFDLGIGPTVVEIESQITMCQREPVFGEILDAVGVVGSLGLSESDLMPDVPVQIVSCGVPFILVPLKSLDSVKRARLNLEMLDRACVSVASREVMPFCLGGETPGASAHARMFAPRFGIVEDPATGGAQGPLGAYRVKYKLCEDRVMLHEQGFEMGRPSHITVEVLDDGSAKVGGQCILMGEGLMMLP